MEKGFCLGSGDESRVVGSACCLTQSHLQFFINMSQSLWKLQAALNTPSGAIQVSTLQPVLISVKQPMTTKCYVI